MIINVTHSVASRLAIGASGFAFSSADASDGAGLRATTWEKSCQFILQVTFQMMIHVTKNDLSSIPIQKILIYVRIGKNAFLEFWRVAIDKVETALKGNCCR
jgi:hypothetical protein